MGGCIKKELQEIPDSCLDSFFTLYISLQPIFVKSMFLQNLLNAEVQKMLSRRVLKIIQIEISISRVRLSMFGGYVKKHSNNKLELFFFFETRVEFYLFLVANKIKSSRIPTMTKLMFTKCNSYCQFIRSRIFKY